MFLFSAEHFLNELERFEPDVVAASRHVVAKGRYDLDFFRLDEDAFKSSPAISLDYALMERTDKAVVVPANMGWSDVGSWISLWEIGPKDDRGNVVVGDVVIDGVRNSYVRTDGDHLVAALGVEDIILVVSDDVVLAAARDKAQDVKGLVEALVREGRSEPAAHRQIHRPWGSYRTLRAGPRFQVKELTLKPEARLSLQMHHHRAEHWVVVSGTARVTRGEETFLLRENQSTYIPLGVRHRLENPGTVPLHLIEVQSGGYIGEDDIVRFDDSYGRT